MAVRVKQFNSPKGTLHLTLGGPDYRFFLAVGRFEVSISRWRWYKRPVFSIAGTSYWIIILYRRLEISLLRKYKYPF